MCECILEQQSLAISLNQFHLEPEKALVIDLGEKGKIIVYKENDLGIPLNPEATCHIKSIVESGSTQKLLYLGMPCFKCQGRLWVRPVESENTNEL